MKLLAPSCLVLALTGCAVNANPGIEGAGTVEDTVTAVDDADKGATRPLMGWSPWNYYHRDWDDSLFIDAADRLRALGLKDAGYKWLLMDGGWWAGVDTGTAQRAADGTILVSPEKFGATGSLQSLVGKLHGWGFAFGHYTSAGPRGCNGDTQLSYGHEAQDAKTFAGWGIDLLKIDACNLPKKDGIEHTLMNRWVAALDAASPDKEIRISNSRMGCLASQGVSGAMEGGNSCAKYPSARKREAWCDDVADQARVAADSKPCYVSMMASAESIIGLAPDMLPDPDFLEVGNVDSHVDAMFSGLPGYKKGGLTKAEQESQFDLWAITSSPLVLSTNLATLEPWVVSMVTNAAAIDVNQSFVLEGSLSEKDRKFRFGNRLLPAKTSQRWGDAPAKTVWYKPLPRMRAAVLFHNRTGSASWDMDLDIRKALPRFAGVPAGTTFDALDVHSGVLQSNITTLHVEDVGVHASRFFVVSLHP